ncbi:hypothetical protein SAMN05216436_10810 [bacterium A37T11]|nr:hypothetical protein SAMN05216436_10810 [bacterium A37T11]
MVLGILILFIFIIISSITVYRIQLGFSLILACRLLVPAIVRVPLGIKDLSLNSCLTLVLIGVFLYKTMIAKEKMLRIPSYFLNGVILFALVLFILCFFAGEMTLKIRISTLIQMIYTEFTLCFIGWCIFKDEYDISRFAKIIAWTVFLITFYGCVCYITHSNPYVSLVNALYNQDDSMTDRFSQEERAGLEGRVLGTMMHPLTWGGSCVLLFFFFIKRWDLKRWIQVFLLILLFVNVIFSGSRSALLAMIIGIFYYTLKSSAKMKFGIIKYSVIGAFLTLIALYQIPALTKYQDFFESTVFFWDSTLKVNQDINGSSASMRYDQLLGSFKMIERSPLVGLGLGYGKYYNATYGFHPVLMGFESLVFLSLVESGYVGFIMWLYLFFVLLKNTSIVNRYFKTNNKSLILKSDFAITQATIFSYFFFCIFTGIQSTLYLFLILYVIQIKSLMLVPKKKVLVL